MPRFYIFTSRSNVRYQHQPDEVPRPPSAIHFDEDFWRNPVAPIPLTFRWPHPWTFEQNESPTLRTALVFDEWQSLVRPTFVYAVQRSFTADDIFVAPAPVLHVAEFYWQNPVAPIASYPVPKVFSDDDVIEVQPPVFAEDYWLEVFILQDKTHTPHSGVSVFYADETIIPTPPIRDEDCWINSVAPVAATNYLPLPYLPDVEEIPAGSLIGAIPPDVIGSGQIERVFGSGTATVPRVSGAGQIRVVTGGGKID